MKLGKLEFRGKEIYITDYRIAGRTEKRKDLNHYALRHGDDGMPCSIERGVLVNHFGDIATHENLEEFFNNDTLPWIEVTDDEISHIYNALNECTYDYDGI